MSEGLSTRALNALEELRSGRMRSFDGWYMVGMMEAVGRKTIEELSQLNELEFEGLPAGSAGPYAWRRVRVRFRPVEKPAVVGDDRVVVLLAEILAVLRDRL